MNNTKIIDYKNTCAICGSSEGELSFLNFGKRYHMQRNDCCRILIKKNELLQLKIDAHIEHIKMLQSQKDELQAIVNLVRCSEEKGIWFWQGDNDHPESLSCPVVMTPEKLREMLNKISKLEEIIEVLK